MYTKLLKIMFILHNIYREKLQYIDRALDVGTRAVFTKCYNYCNYSQPGTSYSELFMLYGNTISVKMNLCNLSN